METSEPQSMLSGDLSDEQFVAIGKIVVEWAFLEWEMHTSFSRLAGFVPGRGEIAELIAAKIRRIDVLDEILRKVIPETWSESRKSRFNSVLDRIRELNESRNRFVHWTWWGISDDRRVAWMESMVSARKPTPKMMSIEELEALAREINTTCAQLAILVVHDLQAERL